MYFIRKKIKHRTITATTITAIKINSSSVLNGDSTGCRKWQYHYFQHEKMCPTTDRWPAWADRSDQL